MTKEKKPEIPLAQLLQAIDRGDKEFYNELSPELKATFSSWMTMRWASTIAGDGAGFNIILVNTIVNASFSSLIKHPELQWKLIASCGNGKSKKRTFIRPGRKRGKNKLQEALSKLYPNMKSDELALFESIHSKDEIKEVFADAGYDKKQIKEITK